VTRWVQMEDVELKVTALVSDGIGIKGAIPIPLGLEESGCRWKKDEATSYALCFVFLQGFDTDR